MILGSGFASCHGFDDDFSVWTTAPESVGSVVVVVSAIDSTQRHQARCKRSICVFEVGLVVASGEGFSYVVDVACIGLLYTVEVSDDGGALADSVSSG